MDSLGTYNIHHYHRQAMSDLVSGVSPRQELGALRISPGGLALRQWLDALSVGMSGQRMDPTVWLALGFIAAIALAALPVTTAISALIVILLTILSTFCIALFPITLLRLATMGQQAIQDALKQVQALLISVGQSFLCALQLLVSPIPERFRRVRASRAPLHRWSDPLARHPKTQPCAP